MARTRPIVAAPFSFTGAAQRTWRWAGRATRQVWAWRPAEPAWGRYAAGAALALMLALFWAGVVEVVLLAWAFVAFWYAFALTLFLPFTLLWRGLRRHQRRRDEWRAAMLDAVRRR